MFDDFDLARTRRALDKALSAAFLAETDADHHGLELSISGIGACTRAAVYRLAQIPPTDTPSMEKRQANFGTWIHAGLLPRLAEQLGAATTQLERKVTLTALGATVDGSADLYASDTGLLLDLKTIYAGGLTGIRRHGPPPAHRMQVDSYAAALTQTGAHVEATALIYLDRSSGESETIVTAYGPDQAEAVTRRLEDLERYAKINPNAAPRDERGPGLSIICDGCPWLRACWGPDATPGQTGGQRVLAYDQPSTAKAAAGYDAARTDESQAKARKDFYAAVLRGADAGIYDGWSLDYGRPSQRFDQARARALLAGLGIAEPKTIGAAPLQVERAA